MDLDHAFTTEMPAKPWLAKPPDDRIVPWCSCGHWYLTLAEVRTTADVRDAHALHVPFASMRQGLKPDPTIWWHPDQS